MDYSAKHINLSPTLYKDSIIWLIAVSAIFGMIIFVFFIVNFRMKYNIESIDKLKFYSEIENYSKYLKNMKNNNDFKNQIKNEHGLGQ